jgi:hypothetical protein
MNENESKWICVHLFELSSFEIVWIYVNIYVNLNEFKWIYVNDDGRGGSRVLPAAQRGD